MNCASRTLFLEIGESLWNSTKLLRALQSRTLALGRHRTTHSMFGLSLRRIGISGRWSRKAVPWGPIRSSACIPPAVHPRERREDIPLLSASSREICWKMKPCDRGDSGRRARILTRYSWRAISASTKPGERSVILSPGPFCTSVPDAVPIQATAIDTAR